MTNQHAAAINTVCRAFAALGIPTHVGAEALAFLLGQVFAGGLGDVDESFESLRRNFTLGFEHGKAQMERDSDETVH